MLRTFTVLVLALFAIACQKDRPCGALEHDPVRNVCVCPDGTGWDDDAGGCAPDGGPLDAGVDGEVVMDGGPADPQGPDGGPFDAGPIVGCDPLTHAECGAGERCAWVAIAELMGETRCVADGTVAEGGTCAIGPVGDSGYDDCQRGLVCIAGVCTPMCDLVDEESCGTGTVCVEYGDILVAAGEPIAGACQPTCDPLARTPELTCPSGQGCYELPGTGGERSQFSCAPVPKSAGAVGAAPALSGAGTPFVNGCVAGARPLMARDGSYFCSAYCQPVETHSGSTAGANGASPYRCQDLGGGATDACVFNWVLAGAEVYDPAQNELGTCLPTDRVRTYDHDANAGTPEVPSPSCTLLPNTDTDGDGLPQHLEVGCAPLPAP